ncbi:hypothetical protein VTN02DRAFT_3707 [Thermoascus thermophilus]
MTGIRTSPELRDPAIAVHAGQQPSRVAYVTPGVVETAPVSGVAGIARRTLGIGLLLIVVVLWTASNFLASTIFADSSFSKPFFVTYVNTSLFILPLIPIIATRLWRVWRSGKLAHVTSWMTLLTYIDSSHDSKADAQGAYRAAPIGDEEDIVVEEGEGAEASRLGLLESDIHGGGSSGAGKLGLKATARLSFQFCMLWFLANYFAMACLQYTTVGSTTILTSTSGVWTLIFGAFIGVEKFTVRKFLGVFASLVGIILISRVDLTSSSDSPALNSDDGGGGGGNQGSFPHKTPAEIALGDAMAAFSSVLYGVYTIVMKKQVDDESRVDMQLFFGLVGLFNVLLLWPGFFILHWTGIEPFALPDTSRVWAIVLVNSLTSLVSDICWAYAMLLTTPLVVTVGLSLTIPLSLVGQMILQGQYSSFLYWVGAAIVFLSFIIVNHESKTPDGDDGGRRGSSVGGPRPYQDEDDLRR